MVLLKIDKVPAIKKQYTLHQILRIRYITLAIKSSTGMSLYQLSKTLSKSIKKLTPNAAGDVPITYADIDDLIKEGLSHQLLSKMALKICKRHCIPTKQLLNTMKYLSYND